jgi:hypothetical protein
MATTCIFDSGENLAYLIFEYAVVSKDVKEISHCPHPAACPHMIATAALVGKALVAETEEWWQALI